MEKDKDEIMEDVLQENGKDVSADTASEVSVETANEIAQESANEGSSEVSNETGCEAAREPARKERSPKGLGKVKLLVCLVVGAVIAMVVLFVQGAFSATETKDVVRIVCDAFFAAGALLLVAGALVWTFDNGITDGITYSIKSLGNLRRKDYESKARESYSEYRERKHRSKGTVKEFLVAGGGYFLVSVALLFLYNSF